MGNATIDLSTITLPATKPAWMDARDWRIARPRWGDPAVRGSLRDLAEELGLTRERVRQRLKKLGCRLVPADFPDLRGFVRRGSPTATAPPPMLARSATTKW